MKKNVILVVSFGTSYKETRDKTIGAIENELSKTYPNYEIRRAFTSKIIIKKLKERDNIIVENVDEAMLHAINDGIENIIVQPTHIIPGIEYDEVVKTVNNYKNKFNSLKIGTPLLYTDNDYINAVDNFMAETNIYNNDNTTIVIMGHGTEHSANRAYKKLQDTFYEKGYTNYIIGTVEAKPDIDDVIQKLKIIKKNKVVIIPFMIVAGDHANNDMAGNNDNSWKSILTKEGYNVRCVLKGLGEYNSIRKMFADKVANLI